MERIDRGVWLTTPGEPDIFQCVDIESCNLRLCRIIYNNNDIYITYGPHVSLIDWLLGCLLIGCLLFRSYVISVLEYFVGRSKAHAVNILLRTPSTYWFCTLP